MDPSGFTGVRTQAWQDRARPEGQLLIADITPEVMGLKATLAELLPERALLAIDFLQSELKGTTATGHMAFEVLRLEPQVRVTAPVYSVVRRIGLARDGHGSEACLGKGIPIGKGLRSSLRLFRGGF